MFQGHQPFGSGEEDFLRFLPLACWPSWSCDQDRLNILSFPHPAETLYEMIGLVVSEEMMFRVWTTMEANLSYELTSEPLAQMS